MKKLICILLMAWLPVFMVTASAMSLQMALPDSTAEQVHTMSCHDEANNQSDNAEKCMSCGFCAIATSLASIDGTPAVHFLMLSSAAPAFVDVIFNSNNQDPAFRPPILT